MAAVLDALAPYVKKLIIDMAQEEACMLLGVSGEIKKLDENMESLRAFLADAERRCILDQGVQRWVGKLKDAMYDAMDILDLCQLEADRWRGSTNKGWFQPLLFCLRDPVFAHNIGSQIKELNQRLDNIHKWAANFNFITNLGSNLELRKLTDAAKKYRQKTTSEFNKSAIVGEKIEKDTKEVAQMLITNDNYGIKVVSIVGTGGMGKTTLAQKIFNERSVQEHFKVKVWLSITQHFDEIELLRTAIEHAEGVHGGAQDKTLLTRTLTNTLSIGRFLLILDDMWGDDAWTHVLSVPIRNASQKQPGNCVLITTRLGDMAQRMGVPFYQHHISPLDEEDAWCLLNKQLPPPPNQVVGTNHLRDIGMKIIGKCGGLPLAVKVMGGMLSTRSRSEREWEAVLNHHAWSVDGLPKELDSRIYLSYEDLSPQLKQCFLYCSLFPKGTSIQWHHVIPMWISEGFVQSQDGCSSSVDQLEEIAAEYYKELIMRNLIEPTTDSYITRYKCRMHDVVRSFAEFMARRESLVVQDRYVIGNSNESLLRRMSVGPSKLVPEWAVLRKQESLRTLIINCKINIKRGDSLASLSRLRVLSIKGGDCDRLVGSLCQLRHLRYLCLVQTNISRLPDDIHRMKFLQHILLLDSKNLENLPSSIVKLFHLRTLNISGSNINVVIPKEFGGLTNLRSLYGFPVHMDMDEDGSWCSLQEIGPLSQLRRLTLNGLENLVASSLAEMAMISRKEHLDYLELNWSSSRCMELRYETRKQQGKHIAEDVLEKLCPPSCIQHIHVQGYFGCILPNWMMVPAIGHFKSLRYLTLKDLPYCTKLPDGLCRLLSLEALNIIDAPRIKRIGLEFQASYSLAGGGVTTSTSAAFPNLTNLQLEGLCEWEEWEWEEQAGDVMTAHSMAMPSLKGLTIQNCKLSRLPPGLASSNRHALRELYLYELTDVASVENFPSVVELDVFDCRKLKRMSGLSRLQRIRIFDCPNLEVLEGVPVLDSLELKDPTMETLPRYLEGVNPRYLKLTCSKRLYESLLTGCSSECDKIIHIKSRAVNYITEDDN